MGGPRPMGRGRPPAEAYDRFPGEASRHRELRLPGVEGRPILVEAKSGIPEVVQRAALQRRFGMVERGAERRNDPSSSAPPWGLLGFSAIGLLGLQALGGEALRLFAAPLLLGAGVFFGDARAFRPMALGFAWPQRLRALLSFGAEKVERLRRLGETMESAGYLREARERYETAVALAEKNLAALQPRGPENRPLAGEARRLAAEAHLSLGAFWDRRGDRRDLALENYQAAFRYLETLGWKPLRERISLALVRQRLEELHLAEAGHWEAMGDRLRLAENYEAVGDYSADSAVRLRYWKLASRAYIRLDSPRFDDFARVMQKIHGEE